MQKHYVAGMSGKLPMTCESTPLTESGCRLGSQRGLIAGQLTSNLAPIHPVSVQARPQLCSLARSRLIPGHTQHCLATGHC